MNFFCSGWLQQVLQEWPVLRETLRKVFESILQPIRKFKELTLILTQINHFLKSIIQKEVYAQSTAYPRAIMSVQQFMNGMFNPKNTALEWDENKNFQAFVFTNQPLTNDPLLFPMALNCPRFGQELVGAYAPVVASRKTLFNTLTNITGQNILTPFDVIGIYYALKTEVEYGLKLPAWAKPYYPDLLRELSNEAWGRFASTDGLKTILGGNFLQKLQADWQAKIAGTSARKLFIYSGHDATVVSVLAACNVWNPLDTPDYAVTAIFELRQHKKTGAYGVQVYIKNEPKNEAVLLTIPGCKSFCPIADFASILANHLPTATSCNAI